MSDINFLQNNPKNRSSKQDGRSEARKIKWTKPVKNKDSASQEVKADFVSVKSEKNAAKLISDKKTVFFSDDLKNTAGLGFLRLWPFFKKNKQNDALPKGEKSSSFVPDKKEQKSSEQRNRGRAVSFERNGKAKEKDKNKSAVKMERGGLSFRIKNFFSQLKFLNKGGDAKQEKENSSRSFSGVTEKEPPKQWKKSQVLETNLIKGELASFFNWKKGILILVAYSLASGFIVAGLYGGLLFWEKQIKQERSVYSSRIRDLDEKVIKPLEKEAKKILSEQKRLKLAEALLKKHIYWTNFFEFLENNTLPNVYYNSDFSGNIDGQYFLSARSKDFKTILEQVDVMRENENVKEIAVDGGSVVVSNDKENLAKSGGVEFKLKLVVDPSIFTK